MKKNKKLLAMEKTLKYFSKRLTKTKYKDSNEMFKDLHKFQDLEKEIEIFKCYIQLEA